MNPQSEKPVNEEVVAVKSIGELIKSINADINAVESLIQGGSLNVSDHDETAEAFGKPESTLREYFNARLRNLSKGITFVKNQRFIDSITVYKNALISRINKIFNPEIYVSDFIGMLNQKLIEMSRMRQANSPDEETEIHIEDLKSEIRSFNSYIKGRGLDTRTKVAIIKANDRIADEYPQLPRIEIELN